MSRKNEFCIKKEHFGFTKDNQEVSKYIISNAFGMEVHFIDFGANIVKIIVADKDNNLDDIALGYDDIAGYEVNSPGFGSLIGRNANRIGGASFDLNGLTYELERNTNNNNLHGGSPGYNRVMYQASTQSDSGNSITFSRTSPDMEQGFPGNLKVSVKYTVTSDNELIIEYEAISDKDTLVNLTNHSYFNLDGHNKGSILDHKVWINSDAFTATNDQLITTGEIVDVSKTPMDFRIPKTIGQDIEANYRPLQMADGYDHNYVLNKQGEGLALVASLQSDKSKRLMEVFTDTPGLQLYTGNSIGLETGKEGAIYKNRDGICFETQQFPNAVNIPSFPSPILKAGETYKSQTIYKFSVIQ